MLNLRNTDKEGEPNKLNNDKVIDRNFPSRRIYYGRVYYG